MGKPKIRECAYCGQTMETTRDHIIPLCLFEQPYPNNLITVPACRQCNNAKSRDDDFLRDLLTSDIYGNTHPIAQRIYQNKMLSSVRQGSSSMAKDVIENATSEPFYSHDGVYLGEAISAPCEQERMCSVFSALVRGLYYNAHRQQLPNDYDFEITRFHPPQFAEFQFDIGQTLTLSETRSWGDVFSFSFASFAREDSFTTIWLMCFYEQVCIAVTAIKPQFNLNEAGERILINNPRSFGRR